MKRIEYYGLVGLCGGNGFITRQQDKERFEKSNIAMADFIAQGNKRSLSDFYEWLQEEMIEASTATPAN